MESLGALCTAPKDGFFQGTANREVPLFCRGTFSGSDCGSWGADGVPSQRYAVGAPDPNSGPCSQP